MWQASDDAVLAESTPVPVNPAYFARRRTRRLGRSGRDIRALRWAPDGLLVFGRDPSSQREDGRQGTEYSSTRPTGEVESHLHRVLEYPSRQVKWMFLVFPELLSLHEDGLLHRIVFECNKNDQVWR